MGFQVIIWEIIFHQLYLAGPLPEGEDMAVAEINLKAIVRQKNMLDTVGHYSRPDILRLRIDRSPREVIEEMVPELEEISESPSEKSHFGQE